MSLTPFHVAFPVDDLDAARTFYGTTLGSQRSRRTGNRVFLDPAGNALEFKAFADIGQFFAK